MSCAGTLIRMKETGWQVIGHIAKARRERLGLNQDELAQYGGPKVATVGKFERAAQESFPLRTQHQMENALGWARGTVEQVVNSIDDGSLTMEDWEHDLVVEDVPDMSRPVLPPTSDGDDVEQLEAFASVFRLVPPELRDDALRAALVGVLPFLDNAGAKHLGQGLRSTFPPRGGDGNADADAGGPAPTSQVIEDAEIVSPQEADT